VDLRGLRRHYAEFAESRMSKSKDLTKVRIKREGKFKKLNITQLTESELESYLEGKGKQGLIEITRKLVSELRMYKGEFTLPEIKMPELPEIKVPKLKFEMPKLDFEVPQFDIVPRKKD